MAFQQNSSLICYILTTSTFFSRMCHQEKGGGLFSGLLKKTPKASGEKTESPVSECFLNVQIVSKPETQFQPLINLSVSGTRGSERAVGQ